MQENIHKILTVGMNGQRGFIVSIETVIRRSLFQFEIIGLANKTISESKQRILSALDYSLDEKKQYINKKITTLLSPAGIKKEGSHFDLPIAVSYIVSSFIRSGDIVRKIFKDTIIIGELTLTGSILPVPDAHKLMQESIKEGFRFFVVPRNSNSEYISEEIHVWEVSNISEIIETIRRAESGAGTRPSIFKSNKKLSRDGAAGEEKPSGIMQISPVDRTEKKYMIDSIKGNDLLKRALEISLSGKHHVLFIGEPGSGKSLIAKSARELIPQIKPPELNSIQLRKMLSSGTESERTLESKGDKKSSDLLDPPFREPHHTSSYSEIIGNRLIEGEVALAHKGILFLDELSEVNKRVMEGLRQPLEDRYIQKNQGDLIESDFILIGCMNPCDCGFLNSKNKRCVCARAQIEKFNRKMMSPLFQRFDICVHASSADSASSATKEVGFMTGKSIHENTLRVREMQDLRRSGNLAGEKPCTQKSRSRELEIDRQNEASLGAAEKDIIADILKRFYFSKREISSLLRVARTIADIEGSEHILEKHILESLSFKNKSG